MAKNILIIVLILAALGGGAYALMNRDSNPVAPVQTTQDNSEQTGDDMDMPSNNQNTQQSDLNASTSVAASDVKIENYAFAPSNITVKKGAKVTWTNQDSVGHDISPDAETADFKQSELLEKGESYSVTFNTAGTYTYHCSPHPYMKGTVTVTE